MTYRELDTKAKELEGNYKKRVSVKIFANTVSAFLAMIGALTLFYGYLVTFDGGYKQASSTNIPIISGLWRFIENFMVMKIGVTYAVAFVSGAVLFLLISMLASGVYALVVYNTPIKIKAEDQKTSIDKLEKLYKRIESDQTEVCIPAYVGVLVNLFFFTVSVLVWLKLDSVSASKTPDVSAALSLELVFFLPCWILKKLSTVLSAFLWKDRKYAQRRALKEEISATISQLNKEEEEKKAELERKKEQEKREKELEEARKQQEKIEKDFFEGEKMYKEAIASEPADEELIKKAAKLGSVSACYHMGKKLLSDWLSGLYTAEEKEEIAEDAAEYFAVATQFAKLAKAEFETECTFLWLFCRLQYECNTKSQWKQMLSDFRKVQKAGDLPEEYNETLEQAIKSVINNIDRLERESGTPSSMPSGYDTEPTKTLYCKFRNGAICTKESNSVSIYHCHYANSPGACSIARDNHGLGYR